MVTHHVFYILHGKLMLRLHKKRHWSISLSFYIRKIIFTVICKFIEIAPHTSFTETTGSEIQRCIRIGKAEILIHTTEIAFLTGKRYDIRRVYTILLVVHIELMNA